MIINYVFLFSFSVNRPIRSCRQPQRPAAEEPAVSRESLWHQQNLPCLAADCVARRAAQAEAKRLGRQVVVVGRPRQCWCPRSSFRQALGPRRPVGRPPRHPAAPLPRFPARRSMGDATGLSDDEEMIPTKRARSQSESPVRYRFVVPTVVLRRCDEAVPEAELRRRPSVRTSTWEPMDVDEASMPTSPTAAPTTPPAAPAQGPVAADYFGMDPSGSGFFIASGPSLDRIEVVGDDWAPSPRVRSRCNYVQSWLNDCEAGSVRTFTAIVHRSASSSSEEEVASPELDDAEPLEVVDLLSTSTSFGSKSTMPNSPPASLTSDSDVVIVDSSDET